MRALCVTTAYDRKFAGLGNYCASTLQYYADVHGHDAYILSDVTMTDRHPAWYRIRLIERLFDEGYDWVLWVDADAMFVRFDTDILSETEEG